MEELISKLEEKIYCEERDGGLNSHIIVMNPKTFEALHQLELLYDGLKIFRSEDIEEGEFLVY